MSREVERVDNIREKGGESIGFRVVSGSTRTTVWNEGELI